MAKVSMKSVNGDSVFMRESDDGILYPDALISDLGKRLDEMKRLPYQPGDILLCSYPKCGTHWVYYLISKLVHGKHITEVPPALNGLIEVSYGSLDSLPSPRILVSHSRPNSLPNAHWDNGKVVLVLRNPKDVAVSLYAHLNTDRGIALLQTWEEFLDSFVKGIVPFSSYFDYVAAWDKALKDDGHENVLVLLYEDLKTNPMECMKRLQQHLGIEYSEHALEKIITECSLSKLKESLRKQDSGLQADDYDTMEFSNQAGDNVLYRKGVVGDWNNHFTELQNEVFEKVIDEKLKDVRFKFSYE